MSKHDYVNEFGDQVSFSVENFDGKRTYLRCGDGNEEVRENLSAKYWNDLGEADQKKLLQDLARKLDEKYLKVRCKHCWKKHMLDLVFLAPSERVVVETFSVSLGLNDVEQDRAKKEMSKHLDNSHGWGPMALEDVEVFDTRELREKMS